MLEPRHGNVVDFVAASLLLWRAIFRRLDRLGFVEVNCELAVSPDNEIVVDMNS